MSGIEEIKNKLASFKRKFYYRQLLVGSLLFLIINTSVFLLISSLEHSFWLSPSGRKILFFGFLGLLLSSLYTLVIRALLQLTHLRKGLSNEDAAQVVSRHFPEIEDRLINTLQLGSLPPNGLLEAAIEKKTHDLKPYSFTQAVDFQLVKRYSGFLTLVILVFMLVSFINPDIVSGGSSRIVRFNEEFIPEAPFRFQLQNNSLEAFRGEDYEFLVTIEGNQLPEVVEVEIDKGKYSKTIFLEGNSFAYLFPNIQESHIVRFVAAGYSSQEYEVQVNERPALISMNIQIREPDYTGGAVRNLQNTGDLVVLEGSSITWEIKALATDSALFMINEKVLETEAQQQNSYLLSERIFEEGAYEIYLYNRFGRNLSQLQYSIDVIKDEFPKIICDFFPDSISFQYLAFGGSISDDYGLSQLELNYRKLGDKKFSNIPIGINRSLKKQGYYANWSLDSLQLQAGETLEVFLSVKDNDGLRGPKESRSQTFILRTPSKQEIENQISKTEGNVQSDLEDANKKAKEIAERLKEIELRLKSEQKFDWQEKKLLKDVLRDREELNKQIERLQEEHKNLKKANQQFQQQSEELQEKSQKLQELMEQLLDEDTRELYEKLKELLEKESFADEISDQTEQLRKREESLERDLERATELFKRLKMESALEKGMQQLDSLQQLQEKAAELDRKESESLQEKINDEFNKFRERMDKVEEMNQELKKPEALQDFELEERQISREQKEALEDLKTENQSVEAQEDSESEQGDESSEEKQNPNDEEGEQKSGPKSPSQQKQKNAAQQMNKLQQKLSTMQGGMQMEMMQANLDNLRDILDNLIKLSFNQEQIMTEMREVNQSDPRFLELSQNQLKLKDDAKVIQDSLLSLASKVVQISSFVTREVEQIHEKVDESIDLLKDRNRNRALSSQQFAMTSMNNLALLLDETLQQMQMAMSEASGQSKDKKDKPSDLSDLQELQNQLGEKINQLQQSGKTGRELSEELARSAAEQEMIRRQMERLQEAQEGKPGGGKGGEELRQAIQMMEQNEIDLVNKRLTQQLIRRQKAIETRMLEAEESQRNQEMEEKREAKSAGQISREMPPGFEEYLNSKKKEIELLKSIPLELNPFYKKEVNDYFRRLSSEKQE